MEAEKPSRKLGKGWISGVLAFSFGLLALLAMLSLQYTAVAGVPEIQNSLGDTGLRVLIYALVLLAFILASISLILRQNKLFGLFVILLVLVTLFIGSMAELDRESLKLSLGLDWFVLNLLLTGIIFIPLERLFRKVNQPLFRFEWRDDLRYFFIGSVMVQSLTLFSMFPAEMLDKHTKLDELQLFISTQHMLLQLAAIMVITDLTQYWFHRSMHKIPFLWKFHSIHHSAQRMDWLAGLRMHILEILAMRAATLIPVTLLGFSQPAIYMYLIIVYLSSTYVHANLNFNMEWLNRFYVTARFHHWHHGIEKEAIDVNFSIHFPIIDKVFGSYYMPKSIWPSGYGIKENPIPSGYIKQFLHPFRKETQIKQK